MTDDAVALEDIELRANHQCAIVHLRLIDQPHGRVGGRTMSHRARAIHELDAEPLALRNTEMRAVSGFGVELNGALPTTFLSPQKCDEYFGVRVHVHHV